MPVEVKIADQVFLVGHHPSDAGYTLTISGTEGAISELCEALGLPADEQPEPEPPWQWNRVLEAIGREIARQFVAERKKHEPAA